MKFNENPSTRSPAAHRAHVQTHGLHSCFRVYFCANVGWRSWKKSRSLARGTWCLSVCCDMPVLRRSERRETNHNKQENMMLQTTNKRRTIKINIYGIYRHTGDREWETSERSEKKIHNKLHEWKGISVSHAPSQWAHRTNENEKKRLRSCIISFAYKVHVRFFFFAHWQRSEKRLFWLAILAHCLANLLEKNRKKMRDSTSMSDRCDYGVVQNSSPKVVFI